MKAALCLSGKVEGTKGRDGVSNLTDYEMCYRHFSRYVIEPNQCDVFFHTWSTELKGKLDSLYQPKDWIFEPQIDFSKPLRHGMDSASVFRQRSKWYSMKQSLNLTQGTYDVVMVSRFDLMPLAIFDLSTFDLSYFYVPNFSVFTLYERRQRRIERWEIPPKRNISESKRQLHDVYFIASWSHMNKFAFGKPRDWINTASTNPHKAIWARIRASLGNPRDTVRFFGHRGYEWDLYRWRICHSVK